jgi:tRNA(Ile)-lysidine synthase
MADREDWPARSASVAQAIPESLLPERVLEAIQSAPASSYALACSGGVDSLALLLWARASSLFAKKDILVVHYNHHLRGESSDADEAFVGEVARALGCSFVSSKRPLQSFASEAALRKDRLAFFHATMQDRAIPFLLLGHQRDDVVETLCMRLGRGSGSSGLSAPRPVQLIHPGCIHLRPFLNIPKGIIVKAMEGVPWREDGSNTQETYLRNRVRKSLIPALQGVFKERDCIQGFARSRSLLEEEDEALNTWTRAVLKGQVLDKGLAWSCLRGLPKALWRRALHYFLKHKGLESALSAQGFDLLLEGFLHKTLRPLSVGAYRIALQDTGCPEKALLVCEKQAAKAFPIAHKQEPGPIPLNIDSTVTLKQAYRLKLTVLPGSYEERLALIKSYKDDPFHAFIRADSPLYYRFWKAGDRYRPLNAPGTKKLQDLFVDKKIPASLRAHLPVILDSQLQILWVPGLPVADSHKILPHTQDALKLTYEKVF